MSNTEFYARNGLQVAPNTRFRVAVGNTGQRPSVPLSGDFRFNTETGLFEGYYTANSTWAQVGVFTMPANGVFGTSVQVGNSTVNVFSDGSGISIARSTGNTFANSSAVLVQNSTVSTIVGLTGMNVGSNVVINASAYGIGNSTVSIIANSTVIKVGTAASNTLVNATAIAIGNSTVFVTVNSSVFSGTSLLANNSSYLGGIAAAQYAYANQIPSSITPGGSNTHVQFNLSGGFQGTAGFTFNFNSNTAFIANTLSFGGGGTINSSSFSGTSANATQALNSNNAANAALLNSQAGSYYLSFSNFTGTLLAGQSNASVDYVCNKMTATTWLYSSGNIYSVGDVYAAYSDARLKEGLEKLKGSLSVLKQLTGYSYYQNELGNELTGLPRTEKQYGLLVQDVERVIPEIVSIAGFDLNEDGTSKSGLNYRTYLPEKLIPFMIEAIKELAHRLDILEEKSSFYGKR